MAERQHERFRVDLPIHASILYKKIASESGVSVPTLLKLVLSDAAKNDIIIYKNNDTIFEKTP